MTRPLCPSDSSGRPVVLVRLAQLHARSIGPRDLLSATAFAWDNVLRDPVAQRRGLFIVIDCADVSIARATVLCWRLRSPHLSLLSSVFEVSSRALAPFPSPPSPTRSGRPGHLPGQGEGRVAGAHAVHVRRRVSPALAATVPQNETKGPSPTPPHARTHARHACT